MLEHFDGGPAAARTKAPPAWVAAVALVLLCTALYVPPAITTPFFTKGEPREGLVVRRMLENGDWVLPKRASGNGWTIASKPPFFHWLAAVAGSALGTTEVAIRLPSVLLGTATVVATWLATRTLLPPGAAFAGAVVLATTFEWVRAVSSARVDATLAALMTGGLLLFGRGITRGGFSRTEALATYGCLACATLTKGPVGFALPGLVVAVALLVQRRLAMIPRLRPVLGGAIIVVVAGAWYLAAWHLGGDPFFRKHILKENVFRFLGASDLKSGHEHQLLYYVPTFAAGFLPWTPFLVAAGIAALRDRSARCDPTVGFLLVWVGVVLAFYSAASAKRSVYLLPLYPAAALLVGWWWQRLRDAVSSAAWLRGRTAQLFVGTTTVAVLVPLVIVVLEAVGASPLARLAPLLHPKDQANLPIVRGIIDAHLLAVTVALAIVLAALVSALRALRGGRWTALFASAAALAIALWLLVFGVFQPALARERTLAPFMAEVAAQAGGRTVYFSPGAFDFGAAFYAPPGTRHWRAGTAHGPGPHYVLVWDDGMTALQTSSSVGGESPGPPEVLARSGGTDPKGRHHLLLVRLP